MRTTPVGANSAGVGCVPGPLARHLPLPAAGHLPVGGGAGAPHPHQRGPRLQQPHAPHIRRYQA